SVFRSFVTLSPPRLPHLPYPTLFRSRRRAAQCHAVDRKRPDRQPGTAAWLRAVRPQQVRHHAHGGGPAVPETRLDPGAHGGTGRSEEHTSELQSREKLVCRLLLETTN